jgi:outer membrane immunogenic protein
VVAASDTFSGSLDIADSGFAGGAQAGYNFRVMPGWVAGVEADIGWLGIDRYNKNFGSDFNFGVNTGWYATVRGRAGRNVGPALLYLTGGAAFVDVGNRFTDNGGIYDNSESRVATGWTIGSGIEAALGGSWTAKTEYLYIDAGSQNVSSPATLGSPTTRFDNRFHIFRFGLSRHFATGNAMAN